MKYLILILCASFIATSCYKEETIESRGKGMVELFDFPQGEHPWDNDIEQIYKKFGIKLIYKKYSEMVFSRKWIAASKEKVLNGYDLNDEQAEYNTNFMKNHVFSYLTPEITNKVLPEYLFMCYDGHEENKSTFKFTSVRTSFNGMDYWLHCMEGENKEGEIITRPTTAEDLLTYRGRYIQRVFAIAINKGFIKVPNVFKSIEEGGEFDYKTRLSTTTVPNSVNLGDPTLSYPAIDNDLNFPLKRGYPYLMSIESFRIGVDIANYNLFRVSDFTMTRIASGYNASYLFWCYLCNVLRFSDEDLAAGVKGPMTSWSKIPIIPSRFPKIFQYRKLVADYMKSEYNIDLEAINRGPEE